MPQSTSTFRVRFRARLTRFHPVSTICGLRSLSRLAGAFVVLFGLISLGCGAATLPPKLSPVERQEMQALEALNALQEKTPWSQIVVGVESCDPPAYSDHLIIALRATDLFARVEALDELDSAPPDLVAVVHQPPRGRAVIPLFTFLSLGLVPTIVDETEGYRFDFHPSARAADPTASLSDESQQPLTIEYTQESKVVIGWLGLALSISPNWTMRDTRRHPRTIDRLRMHLLRQRNAISALIDN